MLGWKFPHSLIAECDRSDWETLLELEPEFQPVIERIAFLAREGLTSLMVLHDFLSHHLVPLQERSCGAWLYTEANDTTRPERGTGPDTKMLSVMLRKLCVPSVIVKNIQIPHSCRPLCSDQAERRRVRDLMPTLDETGLAAVQAGDRDRGVSIPGVPDEG